MTEAFPNYQRILQPPQLLYDLPRGTPWGPKPVQVDGVQQSRKGHPPTEKWMDVGPFSR